MRRLSLASLIGAGILAVAATAGIAMRGGSAPSSLGIPLFRVERGTFVRTATAEGYLRAVTATPITVPPDVPMDQRIAWTVPDGNTVKQGEVVVRLDTDTLEADLAEGSSDLEQSELRAADAEESGGTDLRNLSTDTTLAEKEAEQAETFAPRDPSIFSRKEILDSEIDLDLAREKISNNRQKGDAAIRRNRNQSELLGIDKSQAELKLRRARKGLSASEIRAPHDGLLVLERDWQGNIPEPGAQVWPGQKLAELPDPGRLEVVAYVLEADATGLKAGCRAKVTVEAHPGIPLEAKIQRVDPLAKSREWRVPVQYFEVSLELPEGVKEGMKPGLRVLSEIVLQERPAVLMVPPQAIFMEEGKETVFKKRGSALVPVQVQVEDRGLSRWVVGRGLEEGDEVALRDPRRDAGQLLPDRPAAKPSGPTPEKTP
jgi:multidrug efflux pump subunit AcrA (membrane-fusion protein)